VTAAPAPASTERFVFVSPHLFFGDLSPNDPNNQPFPVLNPMLTGIARADAYCTAVANDPDRSYKAWLSDSTSSPPPTSMRFDTTFSGLYRLLKPPDFPVIATGWQDLTDGTLSNPINAVLGDDNIVARATSGPTPSRDGTSAADSHCPDPKP
jgi:hypothetical protein